MLMQINDLTKAQILGLTGSISWIAADRTADFQPFIGRPVTRPDAVRRWVRTYIDGQRNFDPAATDQVMVDLMRDCLTGLARDGEDVPRLLTWAMSLDEVLLPGPLPERWRGAHMDREAEMALWRDAPAGSLHRQLHDTAAAEVTVPLRQLRAVAGDMDAWCEDPSRRTAWDEELWEFFLGRVWIDPAVYVEQGYEMMLRREWWRRWSARLGPEEAARVGAPLEHPEHGPPLSLDAVHLIRVLPPFADVAMLPKGPADETTG